MNAQAHNKDELWAMTLVELLLVVFVIVILVAMILSMISSPPRHSPANRARARVEMAGLATAVEAYEANYNRLPLADYATNEDITCGISSAEIQGFKKIDGTELVATNSDLILILMDIDSGVNAGHKFNPKQIKYLNAKVVPDAKSNGFSAIDHQYRDPWGNPYVISLDANQDGFVRDAFYACPDLFANHTPTPLINTNGIYAYHGRVMVWSRGPDGKASLTAPANSGVNKDNVFSWE
jgi:type II secretory pathway pseudopilin PulG